jgi:hypothetical protein
MMLYPGATEFDEIKWFNMDKEEGKKYAKEHYDSFIAAMEQVTKLQEQWAAERAAERAAEAAQQPSAPQPE